MRLQPLRNLPGRAASSRAYRLRALALRSSISSAFLVTSRHTPVQHDASFPHSALQPVSRSRFHQNINLTSPRASRVCAFQMQDALRQARAQARLQQLRDAAAVARASRQLKTGQHLAHRRLRGASAVE